MEHTLTCNNLKCRKELGDRALVTTCSHIFCLECVHRFGLATPETARDTTCPACHSQLSKPDDAVVANLNPSEDYKTSVLSGLSPNVIMECAGRALSFWAYQTTQEIYYQQYLYKTLTEKYSNLTVRLDQTVSDANAEIELLQSKLSSSAAEQDGMRRKNDELAQAYRDKSRRLLHTQELYDRVKRKAEMGHIQQAASYAVDSTLHAAPQTQPAAHDMAGYHPDREPGYRNAFALFGHGSRFDGAAVNSGIPRSRLHHQVGVQDRWSRHGATSQRTQSPCFVSSSVAGRLKRTDIAGGLYVPVGPDERQRPANHSLLGNTTLAGFTSTPAPPLSIGNRRSAGAQTPGFAQHRGSLSGIGLSSGLKVSQPANAAGLGASARSH